MSRIILDFKICALDESRLEEIKSGAIMNFEVYFSFGSVTVSGSVNLK